MPTVSAFFGILIKMFYNEHQPPHFHAEYQGERASFVFDGSILAGTITSLVALRLIREWTLSHQKELQNDWDKDRRGENLEQIEPLQ